MQQVHHHNKRESNMSVVPEVPILTKQTYSSPTSFIGATRRILVWAKQYQNTYAKIAAYTAVVLFLPAVYALLTVWYTIIFGLFGVVVFPWRLIRRNQRKTNQVQRAQLATMQAMMAGQIQTLDN